MHHKIFIAKDFICVNNHFLFPSWFYFSDKYLLANQGRFVKLMTRYMVGLKRTESNNFLTGLVHIYKFIQENAGWRRMIIP